MKLKHSIAALSVVVATASCAGLQANTPQIESAGGRAISCVYKSLLNGAKDATAVLVECGGSTLIDIATIAAELITFYVTPPGSSAETTVVALPPHTAELVASLRSVYASARAKIDAQGH
jgi:hypothetical protein